jgi:16S rRNA (guanine966-N2)-methyltransferase
MRVIGGYLGGRQLLAPRGWQVRATPERVREAVFSALGDIEGLAVADLFCGTGALGIEAISRGASSATLVDQDTKPAMGNVHNLGLVEKVDLIRANPGKWATEAGQSDTVPQFDLIMLDPPKADAGELSDTLDAALPLLLAPGGRVVVESSPGRPLELPSLEVVRERRYGRTLVRFHHRP